MTGFFHGEERKYRKKIREKEGNSERREDGFYESLLHQKNINAEIRNLNGNARKPK